MDAFKELKHGQDQRLMNVFMLEKPQPNTQVPTQADFTWTVSIGFDPSTSPPWCKRHP